MFQSSSDNHQKFQLGNQENVNITVKEHVLKSEEQFNDNPYESTEDEESANTPKQKNKNRLECFWKINS